MAKNRLTTQDWPFIKVTPTFPLSDIMRVVRDIEDHAETEAMLGDPRLATAARLAGFHLRMLVRDLVRCRHVTEAEYDAALVGEGEEWVDAGGLGVVDEY